jgi:hypothetical protein
VVPPLPRWLVDDATPEALAGLLATYGRIALLSPEGDVFDQMAGRYNQQVGPNLGVYLKGHARDLLRVDRRGRPPEYVERPCLTIGLAVQPEVLRGLAGRPGFGGRGLLARFLYSLPASLVGHRQAGAPSVPEAVADRYARELHALAASHDEAAEGVDDEGDIDKAGPGRHVGEIGDPQLVGSLRSKVTIYQVRGSGGGRIRRGGPAGLATHGATQPQLAHQALDGAAGHRDPLAVQLAPHLGAP